MGNFFSSTLVQQFGVDFTPTKKILENVQTNVFPKKFLLKVLCKLLFETLCVPYDKILYFSIGNQFSSGSSQFLEMEKT